MEENKFLAFLAKHWSKLLLSLLALACIGVWGERLFGSKNNQSKKDYLEVTQIFDKFQKGQLLGGDSLESAKTILKRHPELHSKMDAVYAVTLFSEAKMVEALPYAESVIAQAKNLLPQYYQDYAATTLLISKGNYSDAYQSSLALQEQLKGEVAYQKLEAMNTLRLVFLSEKMGDAGQKNKFWKLLKSHPAFLEIDSLFQEGSVTLEDYLKKA